MFVGPSTTRTPTLYGEAFRIDAYVSYTFSRNSASARGACAVEIVRAQCRQPESRQQGTGLQERAMSYVRL